MTDLALPDPLGLPGINLDQTPFQTQNWADGQWARFYNGVPRKIGGYIVCSTGTNEVCRGMFGVSSGVPIGTETNVNTINLYYGYTSGIFYFPVNDNANSSISQDVTPAGYVTDIANVWDFDQFTVDDTTLNTEINYILAHVSPSSSNINSTTDGATYYGINGQNVPFLQLTDSALEPIKLNGFVCVVPPFVFIGGQNGILLWNDPGTLTFNPDNFAAYGTTRLVKGIPIRGGTVQSLLIWSLNALYRVTYNAQSTELTPTFFKEDISTNLSIVSAASVIEIPEISTYVWIGRNCFYQYNGVVKELPNPFNKLWFFNNLNRSYQERCWTLHVPQYNEAWFHFPFGEATECTHAAVCNYIGGFWYSTISARAAGISSQYLSYPLMADASTSNPAGNVYSFWMHEFGWDLQVGGTSYAIPSWIRTHDRMLATFAGPNQDYQTRTRRLEADMFLDGQMTLKVYTKQFPGSAYEISRPYLLRDPDTGLVGKTDIVNLGRIVSYYFESNEVGGFYQFGKNVIDIAVDTSERPAH